MLDLNVVVLALALGVVGCDATETFNCADSQQCRLGATAGTCEPNGSCSFTDATCASGRRFDELGAKDVAGTCVAAAPITIAASSDGWVDQGDVAENNGRATTMKTDGLATKAKRSFVSFDLSAINAGATVTSATLTLCITAIAGAPPNATGRTHDLQSITSAWTETALTWNLQPTVASAISASIVVPDSLQCVMFGVTSDVQSWVNGTANFGWRVSDHDEIGPASSVDYGTRENGMAANRPSLSVTYSTP